MTSQRRVSEQATTHDRFELDRLAEELAQREGPVRENGEATADFLQLLPLSHENPYLTSPDFSVEEFLISRSYTSLPELRTELRDYLGTLKEELVRLINDDYEAFISLSTDLQGEGTRLERLKFPLTDIKAQILGSRADLQSMQDSVKEKLETRATLREEKALLHLLLNISESLSRLETLLLIDQAGGEHANVNHQAVNGFSYASIESDLVEDRSRRNRVKQLIRVATEFSQLLYHTEKARAENCVFVDELQWRIDRVKSTLSSDLDHIFSVTVTALIPADGIKEAKERHSEADKVRLFSELTDCFRVYDTLGLWRDAEDVLRREVVRNFVKKTIFRDALNAPQSPILPRTPLPQTLQTGLHAKPPQTPYTPLTSYPSQQNPFFVQQSSAVVNTVLAGFLLDEHDDSLASLYNKILKFVNRDLKPIMEIAERIDAKHSHAPDASLLRTSVSQGADSLPNGSSKAGRKNRDSHQCFDIMANVFWAEVGRAIMDDLGSVVFSAGRPDEFRQRYETTQAFLLSLEYLAPSYQAVESMRAHPLYTDFERRWQLSVYFQLRWKEIVGKLEDDLDMLSNNVNVAKLGSSPGFCAPQSAAVWAAVKSCWNTDIYIAALGYRFWKLTLQLLSRYKTWLETMLPKAESTRFAVTIANDTGSSSSSGLSRSSTPGPPPDAQSPDAVATDETTLRRCSVVMQDVLFMEAEVLSLWKDQCIALLPDLDVDDIEPVEDAEATLNTSLASLADLLPPLCTQIVIILTRRCCEALNAVKSIPGQFRAMSQKHNPTSPSPYVALILRPLKEFFGVVPGSGEGKGLKETHMTSISQEVLESVASRYVQHLIVMKKQEESLRRLKQGRKTGFSLFGGSRSNQDDDARDEEQIRKQLALDVEAFGKDVEMMGVELAESAAFKQLNYVVHVNGPIPDSS